MFTPAHVAEVKEYFGVFANAPAVTLDTQNDDEEAYIIIGGGLSIGKHLKRFAKQRKESITKVTGYRYYVYGPEGEDDGKQYRHFADAIRAVMTYYAVELFNRVNDRIVTDALAQDLQEQAAQVF